MSFKEPKVALVYDRVNKWGGAERLLLQIHQVFPEAPLYTLVHQPSSSAWANVFKVIPTFFNKFKYLQSRHELLAPFASLAFEQFNFKQYDVVISVTSAEAKSILTIPQTLHLCYCLTPTRYYWSGYEEYLGGSFSSIKKFIARKLKKLDLIDSARPDVYIGISNEVKNRIKKYYQRDSEVVYPGIEQKFFESERIKRNDQYLYVSRMVGYKKPQMVVEAFNLSGKKLVMVGTGHLITSLRRIAKSNITFLEIVSDERLHQLYQESKALVFSAHEDFGLVPLEAMACGCPVIAYKAGGALETVKESVSGVFFNQQTTSSLNKAINKFELLHLSHDQIVSHARNFSQENFHKEFRAKVLSAWRRHQEINTLSS